VFQLGGVVTQGAVGLGALIGHIGQFAYVQGTFDRSEQRVDADAVESGAGVPGNGQDYVLGHVTGRSGGPGADATLQVLGKSFRSDTHGRRHHATYTVNVSHASTHVLRRGAANSVDTDSLNVGQLVWVFGALTDTTLDATATDGVARLLPVKISGLAAGPATDDTITLDVDRIDKREVSAFDFTVGGVAQADPHAFVVDVTGLVTSGIAAGSRVRAYGWIGPVGGEGADASAFALSVRTATEKTLLCAWLPADPNAIDIVGSTVALRLDVTDADLRFVVDGTSATMLAVDPAPQLQGLGAPGVYRILQDNALTVFTEFEPCRAEVVTRAATNATLFVRASGSFDATSQQFSAAKATIVLD
jgi:hypothetical protein